MARASWTERRRGRLGHLRAGAWSAWNQEVPGMDMQFRNRDMTDEYNRRAEELERQRVEAIEREGLTTYEEPTTDADPAMTGVPVDPVEISEPSADGRLGAAVVGGALGAVAGAIVGGPAGAIVGGAVGAAGGAVVASSNDGASDTVYDIDRPDLSGDIRRPRDEDIESRF
jgi:hypothetical protein